MTQIKLYGLCLILFGLQPNFLFAQVDEEIFTVVEEMPSFPGCEDIAENKDEYSKCSSAKLLEYIYAEIKYPEVARQEGIEGTAVVRFVVNEKGSIEKIDLLRDIGGGCGEEAFRVVEKMAQEITWHAGKQRGVPVSVYFNLPVKFKLTPAEEPVEIAEARFEGGQAGLQNYLNEHLKYPEDAENKCACGNISVVYSIMPDSTIQIDHLLNFNPNEFTESFEQSTRAIILGMEGKWFPPKIGDQAFKTQKNLDFSYLPDDPKCKPAIDAYQASNLEIEMAKDMVEFGNVDDAFAYLDKAEKLYPNNHTLLFIKGLLFLEKKDMENACAKFEALGELAPLLLGEDLINNTCKPAED